MPSQKKLIFSSLVGLALIAFTGCTTDGDAKTEAKCSSSKCQDDKKTTKCGTNSKYGDAKKVATKCSGGKCGK